MEIRQISKRTTPKRFRLYSSFSLIVLIIVLGLFAGVAHAETIVYRGSSTVGQFMHEAAKRYSFATFDINTRSESSGGEDSVAMGKADIGGVAREVKKAILDQGIQKYLIGKDAIGILVHPSNPVTHLSLDQLARIFAGEITHWNEVGGKKIPIDVYIVNPRSATRSVVQKIVLGARVYGGRRIETVRPDARIVDKVAGNPGALGQLSFSFIKDDRVKLIHPDGQPPHVDNPAYPITRNLYLITKDKPTGKIKAFIDWALSPGGQKAVKLNFIGAN